jgi:hypothetical protein
MQTRTKAKRVPIFVSCTTLFDVRYRGPEGHKDARCDRGDNEGFDSAGGSSQTTGLTDRRGTWPSRFAPDRAGIRAGLCHREDGAQRQKTRGPILLRIGKSGGKRIRRPGKFLEGYHSREDQSGGNVKAASAAVEMASNLIKAKKSRMRPSTRR